MQVQQSVQIWVTLLTGLNPSVLQASYLASGDKSTMVPSLDPGDSELGQIFLVLPGSRLVTDVHILDSPPPQKGLGFTLESSTKVFTIKFLKVTLKWGKNDLK